MGQSSPLRYFQQLNGGRLPGDEMSAKIVSDMVSRRKVFSTIGLSVAFGLLRHHEHDRRTGRHERRHTQRTGHTALSETSSGVVAVSPSAYASPGLGTTRSCARRQVQDLRVALARRRLCRTAGRLARPVLYSKETFQPPRVRLRPAGRFDRSFLVANVPRESGFGDSVDGEGSVHGGRLTERAMWLTRRVRASGSRLGRDDNER